MRTLWTRLKVIAPGFVAGAFLSALAASGGASKMGWTRWDTAEVWASVLTGPFAGLWANATWEPADALGWAVPCAAAIMAHPIRPHALTGAVSAIGVGLWLLLGLLLTYDGV